MGKTDLALTGLERAVAAAERSGDPLLVPMIVNSAAWTYQRQGRLTDALGVALRAADAMRGAGRTSTADGLRVPLPHHPPGLRPPAEFLGVVA